VSFAGCVVYSHEFVGALVIFVCNHFLTPKFLKSCASIFHVFFCLLTLIVARTVTLDGIDVRAQDREFLQQLRQRKLVPQRKKIFR
jgi:hypothetical protein